MHSPVRILLIDDRADEDTWLEPDLRRRFLGELTVVHGRSDQMESLSESPWDVVLAAEDSTATAGSVLTAVKAVTDCPVILLVSSEDQAVLTHALRQGFDDVVGRQDRVRLPLAVYAAVERCRQRGALQEAELRYRSLFNGMILGLYRTSADGYIVEANPALLQTIGVSNREHMIHQRLADLYTDVQDRQRWLNALKEHGLVRNFELQLQRYDGAVIWVENNTRAVRGQDGQVKYYEGSLENITERKWAEQRLTHLAYYDALTGLPNRALFSDRLRQTLFEASRHEKLAAILFLDIDRFKYINDTLGQESGDLLLKAVAARLSAGVADGITVARLGGDEFVILLSSMQQADDVARAAQQVLDSFRQPFYTLERELFISVSLGIAMFPADGVEPEGLLKHAEVAMYRAKERGSNHYQFYASEMTAAISKQLAVEHAMRRALARQEFVLYYQPQVDLYSGRVIGVEALMRWRQTGGTLMAPADFIPIAEETGLIVPLGEWAVHAACVQNRAWQEAGLPGIRMAVNLSARQFLDIDLPERIGAILAETGLDAHYLELEITESVLMQDTAAELLRRLSAMGVRLAIDDFGTGYSSLSYLKRFPIHSMKVDRSFVHDLSANADDAAIVSAIIALAHSLDMKVIAEGVETSVQAAFLRAHGGEVGQGYYFSRPLAADEFGAWLRRHNGYLHAPSPSHLSS